MFRFTIRELVLVTLVVAMGAGWWAHWRQLDSSIQVQSNKLKVWQSRANQLKLGCEQIGYTVTWATDETQTSPVKVVMASDGGSNSLLDAPLPQVP